MELIQEYNYLLLSSYGKDVFIDKNVVIRRPHLVSVGSMVAIDYGFYITTKAQIGDGIHIAPYVTIIGGEVGKLVMGHFTTIAAGCRLVPAGDEHKGAGLVGPTIPNPYKDKMKIGQIKFCDFASIGTNVVIHQGVKLGEGSVVGSCSLVTKDTEPWTFYSGVPAKPIQGIAKRKKDIMISHANKLGYDYSELSGLNKQ